jgi:hypothetical protein
MPPIHSKPCLSKASPVSKSPARSQNTKYKVTPIGLINIQGQSTSIDEINLLLNTNTYLDRRQRPLILGITESFEPKDQSDNYDNVKNHIWIGKPNPKIHKRRGVGFWVNTQIAPRITIALPDIANDNVLWLQYLTEQGSFYIGITYIPPNEPELMVEIMNTLQSNYEEFSKTSPAVILGDLNSHIPVVTGDRKTRSTSTYDTHLKALLKKTNLSISTNPAQISDDQHWTFNCYSGQSVPDYILSDKYANRIIDYHVHQEITCGSPHRLITANLNGIAPKLSDPWGTSDSTWTSWDKDDIADFQLYITKNLKTHESITTTDMLEQQATQTIKLLTKAYQHISKKSKKRPRSSIDDDQQIANILKEKRMLLSNMGTRKHKNHAANAIGQAESMSKLKHLTWPKIHALQQQLHSLLLAKRTKTDRFWWDKIAATDQCSSSKDFWTLINRLKKPTNTIFPAFLKHKDVIIDNPNDIFNHINNFYKSLATNTDDEAKEFFKHTDYDPTNESAKARAKAQLQKLTKDMRAHHFETINNPIPPPQDTITLKEVLLAIGRSKNSKSPGPDQISSECFKHAPTILHIHLTSIFQAAFTLNFTPRNWQSCHTHLLYKKGEHTNIINYRPITLLNNIFKIWERILETRLRHFAETNNLLSHLQMGSRKRKSTIETFLASNLLQHQHKKNPIFTAQVDLSKAYNRVNRTFLWNHLHDSGVPGSLWSSLISTYAQHTDCIKIGRKSSNESSLPNGIRQGSVLSPLLFILYINPLILKLQNSNEGLPLPGFYPFNKLPCFMFVDDLFLYSTSKKGLHKLLNIIIKHGHDTGCIININKTYVQCNLKTECMKDFCSETKLPIKSADSYLYLGLKKTPLSTTNMAHINHRLAKANSILYTMINRGLSSGNLSNSVSTTLLTTIIIPTLTFGMEALDLNPHEDRILDGFVAKALKLTHATSQHSTPPSWTLHEEHITPPSILIKIAKMKLYRKHMSRRASPSILSIILTAYPNNYFTKTVTDLHSNWCDETLVSTLSRPYSKRATKKTLLQTTSVIQDEELYITLPKHNWKRHSPNEIPQTLQTPLPRDLTANIKHLRALFMFPPPAPICYYCNMTTPATMIHSILHCTNPITCSKRQSLLRSLYSTFKDIETPFNSLEDPDKINFLLGLHTTPSTPFPANLFRDITVFIDHSIQV